MGISANTTLAQLNVNGNWMLHPPHSESMVQLHTFFTTITLTDAEENYEWLVDGKHSPKYSTSEVYRKLKGKNVSVPWAQCVWISGGIPRHSFLTWLFVLNRSPTRDRLVHWGLQTDSNCLLCNQAAESRDHLFYLLQPQQTWDQTLIQMQSIQGNKI